MKTLLTLLGITSLALTLNAQTNMAQMDIPAATQTDIPVTNQTDIPASAEAETAMELLPTEAVETNLPAQTDITSDSARCYYNKTNTIILYLGNVEVKDPQMTLTCGMLTAHVSSNRIEMIVAETNVVMDAVQKGKTIKGTCAKAVYEHRIVNSATNVTLHLSGDPSVIMDGNLVETDPIIIDLQTGAIDMPNRTKTSILIPANLKDRIKLPGTPEPRKPEPQKPEDKTPEDSQTP